MRQTLHETNCAAGDVAYAVAHNYNKLPENQRNILSKLADDARTAYYVFDVIDSKVPDEVAGDVGIDDGIEGTDSALPANVRDELLRRIGKTHLL